MSSTGPETTAVAATRAGAGDDADLVHDDTPPPPGRPVRLVPTPSGFWRVAGGAVVALLAPFFGILIGSTQGSSEVSGRMDPLYWGFFIGCLIGALGVLSIGLGARALLRGARAPDPEQRS